MANTKRRTSDVRRDIEHTRQRIDRTVARLQSKIRPAAEQAESAVEELRSRPIPVALLAASALLEIVASRREEKRRGIRGIFVRAKDMVRGRRRRKLERVLTTARDLLERAADRADDVFEHLPRIKALLRNAVDAIDQGSRARLPKVGRPRRRGGRALVVASALLEKAAETADEYRRARTVARPRLRGRRRTR